MLKMMALAAAAIACSACAMVQGFAAANPGVSFNAALLVEARNGANCAGLSQDGQVVSRRRTTRLRYARIGYDVQLRSMLSEPAQKGLDDARDITDDECGIGAPPAPVPTDPPAADPAG